MRYGLTADDSGHWYVIPEDRFDAWEEWLDGEDIVVPNWAHRINVWGITFTDPRDGKGRELGVE